MTICSFFFFIHVAHFSFGSWFSFSLYACILCLSYIYPLYVIQIAVYHLLFYLFCVFLFVHSEVSVFAPSEAYLFLYSQIYQSFLKLHLHFES